MIVPALAATDPLRLQLDPPAVIPLARTAGWIGHALEEYARHTPLRPRARYTGPRYPAPGGNQQGTPRFDGG